ncbi:MAG: crosslink repair DNA glycosylase YcaQ family protein [Myxococcota bacterium]
MTESLSNAEARRIALAAQGFAGKRPTGRIDRRHLLREMARLHLLQLDSVPVVMRTQYMPLFSRLGAYRAELLDEVAYRPHRGRHAWFEAWSHEASLLPVELEPWLRFVKRRAREGETWGRYFKTVLDDPAYLDRVRDEIKSRGPLVAGELTDPRPNQGDWWSNRSTGARALDWLFRVGELGIRRRPGFVKEFDLLERIVPVEILNRPTPTEEASLDELLLRSARAHGIASAACLVDYFRLPVKPSKARLAALVEDGRLVEADVEGWKPRAYLDPEARCPREIRASALLSPFDPVVWCRKRIEGLFDFDYRIEIYVPKEKRRWGYYVLPLLMGDRLVGRFDLKTDRESRVLEVRAAHVEEGADAREVARTAAGELEELARFVGADRVRVGRKGNLARTLSTTLRSKGSRD